MTWTEDTHREVRRLFVEAQRRPGSEGRRIVVDERKPTSSRLARISGALGRIALALEDLDLDEQEDALSTALALLGSTIESKPEPEPAPRTEGKRTTPRPFVKRAPAAARSGAGETRAAILETIGAGTYRTGELAKVLGRSPGTISTTLREMQAAGTVERTGEGWRATRSADAGS